VSVVVPVYNGAGTLDETMRSVRAQSHRELEIIVVDDGSTDDSAAIARRHAQADPRVRLVQQANGGVARARNHGWHLAKADLIAFVDADDLWAEHKIARQLARLDASGPEVGLVYSDFVRIDEHSRLFDEVRDEVWEGDVLQRLCYGNFIGNGSSVLVRRAMLELVDGFDARLHDANAYGCEDLLFYCRVAEHCPFAVVREYDVGYRLIAGRMSGDGSRMLRSWIMVHQEMSGRRPELLRALDWGLVYFAAWQIATGVWPGRMDGLLTSCRVLGRYRPILAIRLLKQAIFGGMKSLMLAPTEKRFAIGSIAHDD